jgi:hypothetical protein
MKYGTFRNQRIAITPFQVEGPQAERKHYRRPDCMRAVETEVRRLVVAGRRASRSKFGWIHRERLAVLPSTVVQVGCTDYRRAVVYFAAHIFLVRRPIRCRRRGFDLLCVDVVRLYI